jgi:hypothetical protein
MNWYDRIFAMFIGFTMTVISSLVLFGLTEKLTVGPAINPSEPGSGGGEVLMFVSASPLVLPGCVLLGLLIGVSAALLYCRLFRRQETGGAQKVNWKSTTFSRPACFRTSRTPHSLARTICGNLVLTIDLRVSSHIYQRQSLLLDVRDCGIFYRRRRTRQFFKKEETGFIRRPMIWLDGRHGPLDKMSASGH